MKCNPTMPTCEYCHREFQHLGGHRGRCSAEKSIKEERLGRQYEHIIKRQYETKMKDLQKQIDAKEPQIREYENKMKDLQKQIDKKEPQVVNNTYITNNIINNVYINNLNIGKTLESAAETFLNKMLKYKNLDQDEFEARAEMNDDPQVRLVMKWLKNYDTQFYSLYKKLPETRQLIEKVNPLDQDVLDEKFTDIKSMIVSKLNE